MDKGSFNIRQLPALRIAADSSADCGWKRRSANGLRASRFRVWPQEKVSVVLSADFIKCRDLGANNPAPRSSCSTTVTRHC